MDNQLRFMYSLSDRLSGANWGCSHIVCDMVSVHELGLIHFKVEYFVVTATWLQHSSGIVQTEHPYFVFCVYFGRPQGEICYIVSSN